MVVADTMVARYSHSNLNRNSNEAESWLLIFIHYIITLVESIPNINTI